MISLFFGSEKIADEDQELAAQWLAIMEKQCLLHYRQGLSEKILLIQKTTGRYNASFELNTVWKDSELERQQSILSERNSVFISKYKELAELDRLLRLIVPN